jgi:predicted DNA-binding transcriptional regulator AlpA
MHDLHNSDSNEILLNIKDEKQIELIKSVRSDIDRWEKLKKQGVHGYTIQQVTGISRATYYRRKKALPALMRDVRPPTKRPKRLRIKGWGEPELDLILQIRTANPTYGKKKIAVILNRRSRSEPRS